MTFERRSSVSTRRPHLAALFLLTLGIPAAFVLSVLATAVHAQVCVLPGYPGPQPSPREGHVMAYDDNGRVLLFGGRDAFGNLLGDTWRWDGTAWTLLTVGGPSARRESAMAHWYSMGSSPFAKIVLKGGIDAAGTSAELWKWDGTAWSQLSGPAWDFGNMSGHFMSTVHGFYNTPIAHDVNVLVGPSLFELNQFGSLIPANGGATSAGHLDGAMTDFDAGTQVIAFGGESSNETDLLHYEQCSPTDYCLVKSVRFDAAGPDARNHHAMAYDGRGALLFGGSSGDARTWRFDDADETWSVVASTGPGPRINHAMAYDPQRHKVVLFGGEWNGVTYDDTWEWDGATNSWTQVRCSCMPPNWVSKGSWPALSARSSYAMSYSTNSDRVVVFGGLLADNSKSGETWEWNGIFWSLRSSSGPPPRAYASMAYDPVRDRTVMFGGLSATLTVLQDTWEWDGLSWTQKFPATSPPARLGHVMAYFPPTSRVTLYGGSPGGIGAFFSDTWTWDGTNWTVGPSGSPRAYGSMTYDPQTQRAVLFGGQSAIGGAPSNGYSLWDGVAWTTPGISPSAARPPARMGAAFAYDPARGRPVLYGGMNGTSTAFADTWELTNYGLFPWSQVTIPGPAARRDVSMAYHQGSSSMILLGGRNTAATANNETWALLADGVPNPVGASPAQSVCEGAPVTFTATFAGGSGASYEWRHDGVLIPGASGASYTIPSVANADAGGYTVTAGNACGSATSAPMALTVRSAPHITVQPQAQTVCAGAPVTFNATATGEAPLAYQWRRNGTPVSTSPALTISAVSGGDAGTYDVVITNACGNATSIGALLVVGCPAEEFRVNAGGPLTNPGDSGPAWNLDTAASPSSYVNAAAYGNNTGSTAAAIDMSDPSIPAGTPMSLFQTERFDPPNGADMSWDFPTGPGTFRVRLYFAEIFAGITTAGQRQFDVEVEGQTALHNFDIFAQAGGRNRGIVRTINATVTDGVLNITFRHGVENPVIFAVEVQRTGTLRVNAGGSTVPSGDPGPAWSSDTFGAPSAYANAAATNATGSSGGAINMTDPSIPAGTPMSLFQSERHDFAGGAEMTWNFPTGAGTHLVRLYFAETFSGITGAGQRVFDVQAEGQTVLKDFDIYKAVGPNKAVMRSFLVAVTDSFLSLTFVHKLENPVVMAIEVLPQASFRVNAGGPTLPPLDSGPIWSGDTFGAPSPYVDAAATGNAVGSSSATIDMTDPSVPPGTPMSLFQTHRYDPPGGAEMSWAFPTGPGSFRVRLYFAEVFAGITAPGQRVFNVSIEGQPVLTNFDIFAQVGLNKALVKTFNVAVADDALNIDFGSVAQAPVVMGLQVTSNAVSGVPPTPPAPSASLLGQNAPNPFSGATTIDFQMKQPDRAWVQIYDTAGRLVVTLLDARLSAGAHHVTWEGRDASGRRLPAGIYMYRLRLGDGFNQSRRILLVR